MFLRVGSDVLRSHPTALASSHQRSSPCRLASLAAGHAANGSRKRNLPPAARAYTLALMATFGLLSLAMIFVFTSWTLGFHTLPPRPQRACSATFSPARPAAANWPRFKIGRAVAAPRDSGCARWRRRLAPVPAIRCCTASGARSSRPASRSRR